MALLEVTDLHAGYNAVDVLRGVGFSVAQGGITTILGANGAGKTTLLRAVSGMIRRGGAIVFDGRRIETLVPEEVARLRIAHVPDGRGTFLEFTTEENLRIGAYTRKDRQAVARDFERVYHYFPRLRERRHQQAGTLSGGEQQMLAIGRALMTNPRLLILDEATEGLAPLIRAEIWHCLSSLKAAGQSILLIDKNVEALTRIADRHYLIERGRVVWTGTSAELAAAPDVQHQYLGI